MGGTIFAVSALGCLAFMISSRPARRLTSAFFLMTLAVFAYQVNLLGDPDLSGHVGIATATVALTSVIVSVVLAAFTARPRARDFMPFLPVVVFAALGVHFAWGGGPAQWSGLIALATGAVAWAAGSGFGRWARSDVRVGAGLVHVLLFWAVVEAVLALLQVADVELTVGQSPLFYAPVGEQSFDAGRVTGSTAHPGTLGKLIYLSVALLLLLTHMTDGLVRRRALWAIGIFIVPLILSEGRANIIATFSLACVWLIFAGRSLNTWARILGLLGLFLSVLVALPRLSARFSADPTGGSRDRLWDVAADHVAENLWFGVGINSYVPVFGKYDSLVAEGWPVHNSVMLVIAEMGLVGAALLFLPLTWVFIRRLAQPNTWTSARETRVILVGLIPGLYIIVVTGWGLLQGAAFPWLMFVLAVIIGGDGTLDKSPPTSAAPDHRLETLTPLTGKPRPRQQPLAQEELIPGPMRVAANSRQEGRQHSD